MRAFTRDPGLAAVGFSLVGNFWFLSITKDFFRPVTLQKVQGSNACLYMLLSNVDWIHLNLCSSKSHCFCQIPCFVGLTWRFFFGSSLFTTKPIMNESLLFPPISRLSAPCHCLVYRHCSCLNAQFGAYPILDTPIA